MPDIPLGRSAYSRTDLAPIPLTNCYFEKAPTNLKDQVSIRARPRLALFAEVGAGPIRGLYRKGNVLANTGYNGQIICLSGDTLYRVNQFTGAAVSINTIDGAGRMIAEGNESVVVLTRGTKAYTTDGASRTQITFPDNYNVYAVDYLNGYFLFCSDLGRFYWSAPGGTTVNALDYATAESQPDGLITLKVIGDELWLFGRYSIEPWQPTGDADLPFQRIGGRIFGIGITGRETAQKLTQQGVDKVCWVGTDRRVYMTDPNPTPISDHGMDERLSKVSDPTLIYATLANDMHGHDFYVLHLTDGLGSWAFDIGERTWSEWTSYDQPNFRGAVSTIAPNNAPLLGDHATSTIWQLTYDQITDGDDPMLQAFPGLLQVDGPPTSCKNVRLSVTTGKSADPEDDPMVRLIYSDDRGLTWDDAGSQSLGRQGDYTETVAWTRLGLLRRPGRVFRWETTQPVTVEGAQYNEGLR